jgi:cation:H+ antiporter
LPLQFESYPLWLNALVFAVAASAVWLAGSRLSGYAQKISERTGIGAAFLGLVLLGGITSLPEAAVSLSAGFAGDAPLAVNNLLGGVAMQVAILAVADACIGRNALSSVVVEPAIILQATLDVLLLLVIAAGITLGETAVLGFGVWSGSTVFLYLLSIWLVREYEQHRSWIPVGFDPDEGKEEPGEPQKHESGLRTVVLATAAAAAAILVAGFILSRTGEAIATQTGLGSSFVGAVLLAISTSLPEISTVFAAMRLRQYSMAFSDIFGTNLFDLVLIFFVDLVYGGPPVLDEVGTFSLFATLLGIAVTVIYIAGLIERKDRTVARMGYDSVLVLVTYLGGLGILYTLR